jgi:hypothetical protein
MDECWDNDDLHAPQERLHGADFEAVDASSEAIAGAGARGW